jgi:hypothetical protein
VCHHHAPSNEQERCHAEEDAFASKVTVKSLSVRSMLKAGPATFHVSERETNSAAGALGGPTTTLILGGPTVACTITLSTG